MPGYDPKIIDYLKPVLLHKDGKETVAFVTIDHMGILETTVDEELNYQVKIKGREHMWKGRLEEVSDGLPNQYKVTFLIVGSDQGRAVTDPFDELTVTVTNADGNVGNGEIKEEDIIYENE